MRNLFIATALSLSATTTLAAGDPAAGAEKAKVCVACHGSNGVSTTPNFPTLAGQHASYLEVSLQGYKDGSRKNAVMQAQAANLSKQDIKDLAAYYSKQKGLYTPEYERQ